jgi:hypothetical protein
MAVMLSRSASIEVRENRIVAYKDSRGEVTCARCNGYGKALPWGYKALRARTDAAYLPQCCAECGRSLRFLD